MMGWVGCRKFVERELTARFYKHTAVALHDWQTYAQLAALARDRLSLEVEVPDLPGLVVDPGVCFMLTPLCCTLSLEVAARMWRGKRCKSLLTRSCKGAKDVQVLCCRALCN